MRLRDVMEEIDLMENKDIPVLVFSRDVGGYVMAKMTIVNPNGRRPYAVFEPETGK